VFQLQGVTHLLVLRDDMLYVSPERE